MWQTYQGISSSLNQAMISELVALRLKILIIDIYEPISVTNMEDFTASKDMC